MTRQIGSFYRVIGRSDDAGPLLCDRECLQLIGGEVEVVEIAEERADISLELRIEGSTGCHVRKPDDTWQPIDGWRPRAPTVGQSRIQIHPPGGDRWHGLPHGART